MSDKICILKWRTDEGFPFLADDREDSIKRPGLLRQSCFVSFLLLVHTHNYHLQKLYSAYLDL